MAEDPTQKKPGIGPVNRGADRLKRSADESTTARPLRIVWLAQGHERYGVGRAILELATGVRRIGHEPHLVCMKGGDLERLARERGLATTVLGIEAVPNFAGGTWRKVRQVFAHQAYERRVMPGLIDRLQALKPDVLHLPWPSFVGIGGRCSRALGVPCFWEMPNVVSDRIPLGLNRGFYQWQCRRYGIQPLANSAFTARSLGDWLVKPIVFHLGVDEQVFDPDQVSPVVRSELGIPDQAVLLGVVARLTPAKGQDRVLEAMMNLVDQGHDLHLLLLGGPTDSPFAEAVRRQGGERVHLVGNVNDPQRYYPMMDLAVNSRVDAEPFGLSVVEAMMMAKPVLVHAWGGPAETVVDGQTGWHVHQPRVQAFEEGLRRALNQRPRWPEMSAAARKRAITHFSLTAQVDRYLAHVRAALR